MIIIIIVGKHSNNFQEEVQKLAGQIQYVKIVGMLMDNRHIREKKDGYFSRLVVTEKICNRTEVKTLLLIRSSHCVQIIYQSNNFIEIILPNT